MASMQKDELTLPLVVAAAVLKVGRRAVGVHGARSSIDRLDSSGSVLSSPWHDLRMRWTSQRRWLACGRGADEVGRRREGGSSPDRNCKNRGHFHHVLPTDDAPQQQQVALTQRRSLKYNI